MKTLSEILRHCSEYLTKQGVQSPRREAEDLLSDVLGCSRITLYTQHDRPMVEEELNQCRERLIRRGRGEPLAYIHGSISFHGCKIQVTPDVLIPRQETEILVDLIIKSEKAHQRIPQSICDVATGSGCIGIALKRAFPESTVTLTDFSLAALEIAKKNAEHNHAEVSCLSGDLLEPLQGQQFDLVVCNPPYITEAEYSILEREVRHFEPKSALVSGVTGLEYYVRLSKELSSIMRPGGRIWLEMGQGQGDCIEALFSDRIWTKKKVHLDWSQKTRFFSLEKESNSLYP